MDRDEFMELVYETFAEEPDNVLANGIIEAADAYVEHEKAQLFSEGATSDLISRQAAIDALDKRFDSIPMDQTAEILKLRKDLRELPPAQPEIVRCKDCIYYNWDCVDAPYGMTQTICWCDLHYDAVNDNLAVNPDDFCSRAERRTDGQR